MSSLHHALDAIQNRDRDLYALPFPDGTEIVFCLPSYKKAQQFLELISIAGEDRLLVSTIYDHIFRLVCQNKFIANDGQNIPAGIPETIAKLVLFLSGLDNSSLDYTQKLLDSYRSSTRNVIPTIKRTICQAFSGYKYHELDSLNYQQLIEVFVQAEKVLQDTGIISEEGLVIHRPEETKQDTISIEKLIGKDAKDYHLFEKQSTGQSLYNDPSYKARKEQEQIRQMRRF